MAPTAPVLAVLVCHDGETWLPESLGALGRLTVGPRRVIAVDTGSHTRNSVTNTPACVLSTLRAIGYEGIYHLPACRSYSRLKRAQRWFCSEEDASAAGFRKALTCR